jgi:hypothetical protein
MQKTYNLEVGFCNQPWIIIACNEYKKLFRSSETADWTLLNVSLVRRAVLIDVTLSAGNCYEAPD